MKANVLITNGNCAIGKHLIDNFKDETNLFAITKFKENIYEKEINWKLCDVFIYEEMIEALKGIDIVIFYLNMQQNLANKTQSDVATLNLIVADNLARACAFNDVKKIVYIKGTPFDDEVIQVLKVYGNSIEIIETSVDHLDASEKVQELKYNIVRSAHLMPLPYSWNLEKVVQKYFAWLEKVSGALVSTMFKNNTYYVHLENNPQPLLILERLPTLYYDDVIHFQVKGGLMVGNPSHIEGRLEFRYLKSSNKFIVHIYDYIPKIPWLIYLIAQAPIHNMAMKSFELECQRRDYQLRSEIHVDK